jgi:small nuclear ribonucleoprotein D3
MAGIGVPIKLLYEAQGLIVSVELSTGQLYRGKLVSIEDNMNLQLREVTVTHRDGHVTAAEQCFLRGSGIRFVVLPDNLRHAPMFKGFGKKEGRGMGLGRARAEIHRAEASKNFLF